MVGINDLPEEIIVLIFSYYVLTEKQCKLFSVLRKVCKTWENASKSSQLWKVFDGTVPYPDFMKMCESHELQRTQEVIFNCKTKRGVRRYDLGIIYSNLPNLRRIDFCQVEKVHDIYFLCLQGQCPNLREIILRKELNYFRDKPVPISKKIVDYLQLCGSQITHLDISYSFLSDVHRLFLVVSGSCSNLTELIAKQIEDASTGKRFPIAKVQKGCSKLKILCLDKPMNFDDSSWDPSNGFPDLEVFSHKCYGYSSWYEIFTNALLNKLLSHSSKLKVLDLRGCMYISAVNLLSLPARDLQKLYISDTRIVPNSSGCLDFLNKWKHSLVKLDFTAPNYELGLINSCMENLENLKVLVLNAENSVELEKCIKNCLHLKSLEVQGCNKRRRLR